MAPATATSGITLPFLRPTPSRGSSRRDRCWKAGRSVASSFCKAASPGTRAIPRSIGSERAKALTAPPSTGITAARRPRSRSRQARFRVSASIRAAHPTPWWVACLNFRRPASALRTAPYGGPTTTDGQLALAALTNTACYVRGGGVLTPPAYGTLGDAGRGIFTGQNYYNVDFSVSKIWKLRERYQRSIPRGVLQSPQPSRFRRFLHSGGTAVVAAGPSSGVGGGFGYATVTPDAGNSVLGSGGPRHVQFGLKLTF